MLKYRLENNIKFRIPLYKKITLDKGKGHSISWAKIYDQS